MKRDAVERKDGLDKIVEPDGLDERCPMIIYLCLATLGNSLAEGLGEGLVDTIRPTADATSPLLYAFSLLRSAFDLSFEVTDIRCSSAI